MSARVVVTSRSFGSGGLDLDATLARMREAVDILTAMLGEDGGPGGRLTGRLQVPDVSRLAVPPVDGISQA